MKANPMEVGELISFYRRQADMTIDELAEKSGVPKGTLNKIIGGVTKAPTLDTMKALAKALGKRLADFEDEPDYANLISLSEKTHIQKYRLLDSHGKEMVDLVLDKETERMEAESTARKEREAMEAGMLAPPAPTPEEEAKAEAESFYQEVLQEKKIQAESSASPSTNGTGEKMA